MELNLPIFDRLSRCRNLLIAGMGGGFDLFCGLPIYFELQRRGRTAHLANFSFSNILALKDGVRLSPTLVGVNASDKSFAVYFPERHLAQWHLEKRGQDATVWCFHKTGAKPLLENYRLLVEHLSIDGILLIDGGVDSLMRGDEGQTGTIIEDAISLAAVSQLTNVPVRLLACLGFGAEENVCYASVLQNIAALTGEGGFLGACSLTPQMEAYQAYEDAVLYAQQMRYQDPSVINSSIVSAARGRFGDYHLTEKTKGSSLRISPLMLLYWFFDLPAVARRNTFLPSLESTETFIQALHEAMSVIRILPRRRTVNLFSW